MKILIGVQGTGNGHLSRCLALAENIKQAEGIEADFLVSGRSRDQVPATDLLGDFVWRQGLSFQTRNGRVSYLDTLSQNPWLRFWQDVRELSLEKYDMVVTDFEPVTAWAAKRQGVPCVGLGRQYAFWHGHADLPSQSIQRAMLRQFAPCDIPLGMHWEPIRADVIPPLIHAHSGDVEVKARTILVYLPFEQIYEIHDLLRQFPGWHFKVFHPQARRMDVENCSYFPPDRPGFQKAMQQCNGIIANAGFETSSEALAAGRRILVKPLRGQFEQTANALCLQRRGLGSMMKSMDPDIVKSWLENSRPVQMNWPDIGAEVVQWLRAGASEPPEQLASRLWSRSQNQAA